MVTHYDNVANNVYPSGWVNLDPNYELSLEEWEVLVAEQNAADDATLAKLEQELEECLVLYNSMDPPKQDELNNRLDLLDEDVDDTRSHYCKFMDVFSLVAAEEHSPLSSLDTVALPPQFEHSPHSQNLTVTSKRHAYFRTQNRPTQHRHPPHNKPLPSQPYPTPRQHQHLDSRTKPHRKHPPNCNLLIETTLDIGSNARHHISRKATRISQH